MELNKIVSETLKHLERERDRIDEAINGLAGIVGKKHRQGSRREMSDESRERIRAAMVKRWADKNANGKGKGKAPVSGTGKKIYPSTVAMMAKNHGAGEIAQKLGISVAQVRGLLKAAAANKKEAKAKPAEA